MKRILSHVVSLLGLTALIAVIVFAVNLRPLENQQPLSAAYPGPNLEIQLSTQTIPYPPPIPTTNNTSLSCTGLGEWKTYTNLKAGYSLKYPAESTLKEFIGSDKNYTALSISLLPTCYGQDCSGSNKIIIGVRENPNRLAIREFIEQEFDLHSSPPLDNSLQNLENSSKYVLLGGIQALRIEDGITLAKPDIFIPNENLVIWVYVSKSGEVPPFEHPCKTTLELLDQILATIKLSAPAQ